MSENKTNIILKRIEIPKLHLWLIWCVLFVFPSILAILGNYYIKREYLHFSKTELIDRGFSTIRKYNDIIAPESFIEEQLKEIKKLDTNLNPEILKKQIEQKLCSETFYCMFINKWANNEIIIKNQKAKNIYSNILKNSLKNLIEAYSKGKDETYYLNIEKQQKHLADTLQTMLKTATPITISLNNVSKSFSVIFDGELYFIFANFDNPSENCSYFFAILQGQSISINKMLKKLSVNYPEIKIVFREVNIDKIYNTPDLIHSGLKRDKNNLFIMAPASLIFARNVLHNGSSELNPKLKKVYPFIEYKIPTEENESFLNRIEKIIYYSVIILLLVSLIFFLKISLFGFNPNMKFKTKIILLTIVSALFPFTIFSIGIYSIEICNVYITKTQIQHQVEVELKNSNQELEHYINGIETKLTDYATCLSEALSIKDLKPSKFLSILSKISTELPISKEIVYLNKVYKNLEIITENNKIIKSYPERISNELFDSKNNDLMDDLPLNVLSYSNEELSNNNRKKINLFKLGKKEIQSHEAGDAFRNDGKLIQFNQHSSTIWYQVLQLPNKFNDKIINGILFTRFETRPILSFFFKKSTLAKKKFKEIKGNYEINYAFLPIEKSGSAKIWEGSGNISDEDRNLCLKNPQSNQIDLTNKTIITRLNQKIPHLAVAIITELEVFNKKTYIIKLILSILFYLSLIVYLSSKLIDIMFIKPVMLLASNAISIAKGSEEWNNEIKSGDEFEELNKNFKNLVTGLKERNILKSYVSEDAFSDLAGNDETNLKPGGEYMEATIVFSALKDYDKLSKQINPKESIQLLSKFMSIAEEVSKKYGGSIDKIIGDTIMLVFRDNPSLSSHGLRAAKASLELVEIANKICLAKLYTGIASGKVISGKIGSYSGKLDFTVIGNPVNSAARFKAESKNGTEKTGIIISGITIGLTKGKAKVKYLRRVSIKGKSRKYNIYELLEIRN